MLIRDAADSDLVAMAAIYGHHVRHGTGTFEEAPPTPADMAARWRTVVGEGMPWLVAEADGRTLGYAYARPYHARSAWRYTLESSVYVAADAARRGAGRALMEALMRRCAALGARQMVAVIGDSANAGSIGLHKALGFRHVGVLEAVGVKFGREIDVVLMQRALER